MARQFAAGDREIDIVGFSRGAALAVHFANVVGDSGVTVNGVRENPAIRFLGVFDVVAAFGIPIDIGLSFNRINLGYKLGLAKAVNIVTTRWRSTSRARPSGRHACAKVVRCGSAACIPTWAVATTITRSTTSRCAGCCARPSPPGCPWSTDCVGTGCTRINVDGKIGENFDKILSRAREPKA